MIADGLRQHVELHLTVPQTLCVSESAGRYLASEAHVKAGDLQLPPRLPMRFNHDEAGTLQAAGMWGGRPVQFIERFGDLGLDLSPYENVMLELAVTFEASGARDDAQPELDSAHGTLTVIGLEDTCQDTCDATGCSGCPPLTPHTLLTLALTPAPAEH